jgi:anti-sigma factor ChrR (cupin superfamily)
MIDAMHLQNLLAGGWRELEFSPFHPGVTIHPLYGDGDGPAAALLRYAPNTSVPFHEHTGFEHILVLDGAQEDENGRYAAGALAINPPGSAHRVWSTEGCVALLIWERPVRMIGAAE